MAPRRRNSGRTAAQPPSTGLSPRYRVLVYELTSEEQHCVMDHTGECFIAAVGSRERPPSVTDCNIGRAGLPRMLDDLALTISDVLAQGDDPSPTGWVRR